MVLELHPFVGRGVYWVASKATVAEKCSLSGKPISVGDAVYFTDCPELSYMRVLVSEYADYAESHDVTMKRATEH